MDLLLDSNNVVCFCSDSIAYGDLDPSEPGVMKWKISDYLYAIGDNLHIEHVASVPEYVIKNPSQYIYTNGTFSINPTYKEPISIESLYSQITELQLALAELVEGGVN